MHIDKAAYYRMPREFYVGSLVLGIGALILDALVMIPLASRSR
jgi:hypothetical protein